MLGLLMTWVTNHPLEALGAMTATALLVGYGTIRPSFSEIVNQHHPRC